MNGYGAIAANEKAEIIFYIACFTSVPYPLQEYVESGGNQLTSGGPVWNTIYTSFGRQKSRFYVVPYKKQKLWLCELT